MKKIMLLSPKDNNFYNFRSELILELLKEGYEVVLNCPYGDKIKYFTDRGCRFIDISIDRRGKSILNDLKLLRTYKRLLNKEKPDVVLTYTSKPSIYGGVMCGIYHIPYIVNNAGLMETTGIFDKFMKVLYWGGWRKSSCMMYQNSYERDVVNEILHNKVHYRNLPGSGVNLKEFKYKPYPSDKHKIVFNYVGRIVELKGINEFIECAERIKKKYSNVEFVVYGDYDDDSYKVKIQELERKNIIRYGGVQLDIKPYIEAAHAVIHPSHYEGMTNVVLEHSALGRPCIGSNIPGVREAIEEGITGFLFPKGDIDELVSAVERFINLPNNKKADMGIAARRKMEKEFDRTIVTNIYLEEIEKIIK